MAPRIYPGPHDAGANRPEPRVGQDVNAVDQLGSVVLLGLALGGAAVALILVHVVIG